MSSVTSNSSRSTTPAPTPGQRPPPKTYDELIDEALDEESDDNTNEVFGRDVEAGQSSGLSNSDETSSPASEGATEGAYGSHDLNVPQMQRLTRVTVDRAARRAKLQPYQLTELDVFVKASMTTQLGLIFVDIQAMKSEINRILVNQPRFTVDEALHKTISAYSLGVLLSEKLREYKRSSTEIVLTIIRNNNANIPSNLYQDPYALSIVKAAISEALTQIRSRIKKLIGKSIDENLSIYQLASKVIEGSQCTVSIPLCACLAVLRRVYTECGSDLAYWNNVDTRLARCREKAQDHADGIRKILAKTLKLDRSTYGYSDTTSIPQDVSNFQQAIDDSL